MSRKSQICHLIFDGFGNSEQRHDDVLLYLHSVVIYH